MSTAEERIEIVEDLRTLARLGHRPYTTPRITNRAADIIESFPQDPKTVAKTFAKAVGWDWESLDPMWQQQFIQAAKDILGE